MKKNPHAEVPKTTQPSITPWLVSTMNPLFVIAVVACPSDTIAVAMGTINSMTKKIIPALTQIVNLPERNSAQHITIADTASSISISDNNPNSTPDIFCRTKPVEFVKNVATAVSSYLTHQITLTESMQEPQIPIVKFVGTEVSCWGTYGML